MQESFVDQLVKLQAQFSNYAFSLVRIYSYAAIEAKTYSDKNKYIEKAATTFSLITFLYDFVKCHYGIGAFRIEAQSSVIECSGSFDLIINRLKSSFFDITTFTQGLVEEPLITPLYAVLKQAEERLCNILLCAKQDDTAKKVKIKKGTVGEKQLLGPNSSVTDSALTRVDAIDVASTVFSTDPNEAFLYFCHLASKEAIASDMCLLNLIEYDLMPLDFYRDMLKQAGDEARHALFFLNLVKKKFITSQSYFKKKYQVECDSGELFLPIPKMHFYKALLNATLFERFVLMQLDTESEGINCLETQGSSSLFANASSVKASFEIVRREEITHVAIGKRWLNYLCSDKNKREQKIEWVRNMRGLLLLTAYADFNKELVSEQIQKQLSKL